MNKFFQLYTCCVPVQGYTQSTICDLQRDAYITIPNELYDILIKDVSNASVEELAEFLGNASIKDWLEYLVKEEYGFFVNDKNELSHFPVLSLECFEPKAITNCIIDFDEYSSHNLNDIFIQLSELFCEAVELRFFFPEKISRITEVLMQAENTSFRSVEVIVQFNETFTDDSINKLFQISRMHKLVLHGSFKDEQIEIIPGAKILVHTQKVIDSQSHCGIVELGLFTSNLPFFSESKKFNSCLNRKVSVDKEGQLCNCPSTQKRFGHVSDTAIKDILNEKEFFSLWNINKDKIEDCKICEYRYMCQDCRAYLKDRSNVYSKPLKCNYNPYEGKWS
ncbi:MAG: grasp-with-spasm system SPASM domain peptide maturase [Agriterribacter sp.]